MEKSTEKQAIPTQKVGIKLYLAIPKTLQRIAVLKQRQEARSNPSSTYLDPTDMIDACELALHDWIKTYFPRGSGFDAGTQLVNDPALTVPKLTFETAFHHMDEQGGYCGWTHHNVVVRPDWDGFKLVVGGSDKRGIKDYIEDCFYHSLNIEVTLP